MRVKFNGKLKPEQQEAANNLLCFDNGILSAATAFGKTVVCSYLIAKRKVSTLILVQGKELLDQWIFELNEFLMVDVKKCIADRRTPVILTRQKDQAKRLFDNLQKCAEHVFILYGDNTDKENREIISGLKNIPRMEKKM